MAQEKLLESSSTMFFITEVDDTMNDSRINYFQSNSKKKIQNHRQSMKKTGLLSSGKP
jgi:hypothetical protein